MNASNSKLRWSGNGLLNLLRLCKKSCELSSRTVTVITIRNSIFHGKSRNGQNETKKIEAQNIKAQTEQQVKNYEALADLSATAAELAVDKQAKKNQEEFDAIFWEEVANAGSLNEQSQLAEVEDEQLLEDGAINATANTVEEQTGSAIEAAQI